MGQARRGLATLVLFAGLVGLVMVGLNATALLQAQAGVSTGGMRTLTVATNIQTRQRLDGHPFDKHGTRAVAALIILRTCSPEVWLCPATETNPDAYVLLCGDVAGTKTAIGIVSATPQPTGEHVLLTHYIAGRYDDVVSRLRDRGCERVIGISVSIP
ncbi:MAG TPA: hypothetical protein EYH32_10195 [Anaerolineae bacterium]|nr:hypothetical protein [Anaerolineae bacterium]